MTLTLTPPDAPAADRFARNCRALGLAMSLPALDFCLGLDGSTTAKRDGRFLAGCSVPHRAAEVMVRKEEWRGRSLCLMVPTHGQQIAVVLDRLGPTRALIVVPNSPADLADFLACVDFTAAIAGQRLFFVDDETSLERLFVDQPGLAVPLQMVRLPDVDATAVARVSPWVQATLSKLTIKHGHRLASASAVAIRGNTGRPCVIAGRHFRTWADAGDMLARFFDDKDVLDTDHPTTAAEAYLAERAATAGAVVSADRPRPSWAKSPRPWITWLTRPAVPPFDGTFKCDGLLLADPAWAQVAAQAGWPVDRIAVAGWPVVSAAHTPGAPLALIADLPSLGTADDIAESSGRQLVWEAIRDELPRDPFAVGDDAAAYVRRAPGRLGLPPMDDFPVDRFVTDLVGPAYILGIAKWLVAKGVAFTLHGRGWEAEPTLADRIRGPVADRDEFNSRIAAAGGLIDPFLTPVHAIRSMNVPRVTAFGRTPQRVLQDVAAIDRLPARVPPQPSLSRTAIDRLLGQ